MTILQIFLQYYYSTILNIELYCSQYCKKKKNIYFTPPISLKISLSSFSFFLFCSLSSFSVLHLLSPLWSFIAEISHLSPKFLTHLTRPLSHCTGAGIWIFEVGGWISIDRWAGFGSLGLKWWICWSVGGSFGLIIGSSDDDFWVFLDDLGFKSAAWVCWSVALLMVCICVCGFVVVGLWLKWLVLLGFWWVFFFFFPSVMTLVFLFIYFF